jgi:hypothetical protein
MGMGPHGTHGAAWGWTYCCRTPAGCRPDGRPPPAARRPPPDRDRPRAPSPEPRRPTPDDDDRRPRVRREAGAQGEEGAGALAPASFVGWALLAAGSATPSTLNTTGRDTAETKVKTGGGPIMEETL